MSADGNCIAITHTGTRCTSPATDVSGRCAHHAQIARVMALAPKSRTPAKDLTSQTKQRSFTKSAPSISPPAPPMAVPLGNTPKCAPSSATSILTSVSSSNSSFSTTSSHSNAWLLPNESMLAGVSATFVLAPILALPLIPGTLFVTNFRLRFEPMNAAVRSPGHVHRLLDDAIHGIPRSCVHKISYPPSLSGTKSDHSALPTQLIVRFKDLRMWTISGDMMLLMTTLNRYCFVDSPLNLFAFVPNVKRTTLEEQQAYEGHTIYTLQEDFARMISTTGATLPCRVTDVNRSYTVCATYPAQFMVPASVTDSEVASVAEFRSKGRLPICSWVHRSNTASIWRCAQPKRGIFNAQNAADARYLATIAKSNMHQPRMWIADCRPELNARANNLTGGGTESSSLSHARVSFLNIANIHAMRESLDSVRSLIHSMNPDLDVSWGARVEETKWLTHVRLVLSAAIRVADAVENQQTTVVVHCSDGWDRTGQLCALSQLLLDRHYRTIVGLIHLIEKEWIRPGHKFYDRIGPGKTETDDQSPIFLQFLDCIWQLWRQFPTYFEFNSTLLETIADALFSGQYGTFLGNCDRERTTWNSATRTPSLWTTVLQNRDRFVNPFYRVQGDMILIPPISVVLRNVVLWSEYYCRGAIVESIPRGNSCPPTWALPMRTSTRSTTQQDLADAMTAAIGKIQVLEQEVVEARNSQQNSSQPISNGSTSTWICSICTKVNHIQSITCVACGRQPHRGMMTQI